MKIDLIQHIKSGEFTFCSICGKNCKTGKNDFICTECSSWLFGTWRDETKQQRKERIMKEIYEEKSSFLTRKYRKDLSTYRMIFKKEKK